MIKRLAKMLYCTVLLCIYLCIFTSLRLSKKKRSIHSAVVITALAFVEDSQRSIDSCHIDCTKCAHKNDQWSPLPSPPPRNNINVRKHQHRTVCTTKGLRRTIRIPPAWKIWNPAWGLAGVFILTLI